jgi:chromosome segregation protein
VHIKGIDLKNFKSFKNQTHIPLFDEFMTISGPNGSGKSNVLDAILFTLGLSKSRDMRAERLTDLIYSSGNGEGINQAEVKVHFDNRDRLIPLDRDAVTISRKVKKTDNGYYSYYYINGKSCTFSEIQETLNRSFITSNSYNVIMQGDVTRILNMSSFERRKIIDEISGVAEFDEKKEQAHHELDEVRSRIERLDIILEELKTRLKILQTERDQALIYENLREEKVRCEASLLLADLNLKEQEFGEIKTSIEDRLEKKGIISGSISKKTAQMEDIQSDLDEDEVRLAKKQEEDVLTLKKDLEEVSGTISRFKELVSLGRERIEDLKTQKNSIFIELGSSRQEVEDVLKRFDAERIRKGSLKETLDEKTAILDGIKKEIESAGSKAEDATHRLYTLREELEVEQSKKNEILMKQDMILDRSRRRSGEIDLITERMKKLAKELDTVKREISLGAKRTHELSRELEENEKALGEERTLLNGREKDLKALERKIMEIEARILAEKEFKGYSEGVKSVMEAVRMHQLEGVYGTIAELGRVENRFAVALEAAAGGKMQYIVVETDIDGQYAIEYLKQIKKGRATFLPLNKLKGGRRLDGLDYPGVLGFAIDLIAYDSKFERAFWHVFRDTVVVESIEDGRRLMDRFRSVTLDGDLIERSGIMTGGTPLKSRFRFTSSTGNELLRFQEERTVLESELRVYLERIKTLENRNATIREKLFEEGGILNKLQIEKRESERDLNDLRRELERFEKEDNRAEIIQLEEALAASGRRISELESAIGELESDLKTSKIPELSKKERQISEEMRMIEARMGEIDLSIKSITLDRAYLEKKIAEGETRLKALDASLSGINDEIKDNSFRIEALESEREELLEREKALEEELSKLKNLFKERFSRIMELREEIEGLKLRRERIDGALTDLRKIEEGLVLQITELKRRIDEAGIDPEGEVRGDHDTISEQIKRIEDKMRALEPVNMKAIDAFFEVESRLGELMQRRNTLSNERRAIIERIEGYEIRKREVFLSTFDAINANFKEVFRELSDGNGEILLESQENPFEGGLLIQVQPAEKPLQRLEALSGGEKSLTALSFLFAIQRYRPAPFYALDEIDMMLDGVNVEKVAKMIKKLSKSTQFIVVSLREPMIECASSTIGVVMQEKNISTITGIRLNGKNVQAQISA